MKKIIVTTIVAGLAAIALAGCWGKSKPKGQLDADAKLYINVKTTETKTMRVDTRADLPTIDGDEQKLLTPREVVEQAGTFYYDKANGDKGVLLSITDETMKDIENAKIKLYGDYIINRYGELVDGVVTSSDVRILDPKGTVIAYIPNATLRAAWVEIQKAYKAGELEKVYDLFFTAYVAIPCTQKQWEYLKEKGLQ